MIECVGLNVVANEEWLKLNCFRMLVRCPVEICDAAAG